MQPPADALSTADALSALLAERSARQARDEETRARVQSEVDAAMQWDISINPMCRDMFGGSSRPTIDPDAPIIQNGSDTESPDSDNES